MAVRPASRPWWRQIDWRIVAVAGLPLWAIVAAFVLWQRFTPPPVVVQRPPGPQPPPATAPAVQLPILVVVKNPDTPREVLPSPSTVVDPPDADTTALLKTLAFTLWDRSLAPGPREVVAVAKPQPVKPEPAKPVVPNGCKTYDTAVFFVKNMTEAEKRAKADGKLVFVLHLSGNLDDDGFT